MIRFINLIYETTNFRKMKPELKHIELKTKTNVVLGLIQIMLSIFWAYQMLSLYYYYHFTDIIFAFMYPNWVLYINIFLCLANIFNGILLIQNKISIKKGYSLFGIYLIIGILINNFYYQI